MIVAFDTGLNTGIATLNNNTFNVYQIPSQVYPHPHEILYDHISTIRPKIIIYEAFHHRQGKLGVDLKGIEFIGVIELWCQQNGIKPYVMTPSDGKGFWNINNIKILGLWTTKKQEMDALKLLLAYVMKFDMNLRNEIIQKLRR